MTRGPYQLKTKDMTPAQRAEWFRGKAKGGRPKKQKWPRLSYILKQAMRQDWGLDK